MQFFLMLNAAAVANSVKCPMYVQWAGSEVLTCRSAAELWRDSYVTSVVRKNTRRWFSGSLWVLLLGRKGAEEGSRSANYGTQVSNRSSGAGSSRGAVREGIRSGVRGRFHKLRSFKWEEVKDGAMHVMIHGRRGPALVACIRNWLLQQIDAAAAAEAEDTPEDFVSASGTSTPLATSTVVDSSTTVENEVENVLKDSLPMSEMHAAYASDVDLEETTELARTSTTSAPAPETPFSEAAVSNGAAVCECSITSLVDKVTRNQIAYSSVQVLLLTIYCNNAFSLLLWLVKRHAVKKVCRAQNSAECCLCNSMVTIIHQMY